MRNKLKGIKVSIYSGLFFAVLFGAISLIFYFGEWSRFFLVSSFGLFVGLVAAPEFEPRAFKKAWLFQLVNGIIAGVLIGLVLGLSQENIFAIAIIGGFVGWSAPYWVKHVQIP